MKYRSRFKSWVKSLGWEDLLSALEFELDVERNEDELLLRMVREQAPPTNPIHPCALPTRKCPRAVFDDDGRNGLYRKIKSRIHQPRLFQWTETGRKQPQRNAKTKRDRKLLPVYDFIARKFIVNGDRLSLGCTEEQRTADESLLLGTVVVEDPAGLSRRITTRRVRFVSRRHFAPGDVLRMLRIASRGNFLCCQGESGPDWFQPTERFFSLSMYLSSRFERSLWEKFSQRATFDSSVCRWMLPDLRPPTSELESLILKAASGAIGTLICRDRAQTLSTTYPATLDLEFLLENHSLIVACATDVTSSLSLASRRKRRCDIDGLLMCDLLLIDTPLDDLRRDICRRLHESLVEYGQKQLEAAFINDRQVSILPQVKDKRQKRRRRQQKQRSDPTPMNMDTGLDLIAEASDVEEAPGTGKSDCFTFPSSSANDRMRNRNIVFCLSIFDDVLSAVFATVGLEPDKDDAFLGESPQRDANPLRSRATAAGLEKGAGTLDSDHQPVLDFDIRSRATLPHEEVVNDESLQQVPIPGSFTAHYGTIGGAFYHRPDPGFVWDLNDDDWGRIQRMPTRESSLLADFFKGGAVSGLAMVESGDRECFVASSTAASVDSFSEQAEAEDELVNLAVGIAESDVPVGHAEQQQGTMEVVEEEYSPADSPPPVTETTLKLDPPRSPSPEAPATPSPTLSPILVSLADLKELQEDALHLKDKSPEILGLPETRKFFALTASSLPSSPHTRPSGISGSASRDDLTKVTVYKDSMRRDSPKGSGSLAARHSTSKGRMGKSRDDQELGVARVSHHRKSTDALSSYRNSFKIGKAKDDHDIRHSSIRSIEHIPSRTRLQQNRSAFSSVRASPSDVFLRNAPGQLPFDVGPRQICARSEIADGQDDSHQWHISHRSLSAEEMDNNTVTKDGSTTITSFSHRETEEQATLREERNAFRDMCLTLGAEVAKLKNLLASQRGTTVAPRHGYTYGMPQPFQDAAFFGPEAFSIATKARTMAAMSDAGFKGEHESLASEDDFAGRQIRGDAIHATIAGSDVSLDPTSGHLLTALPQPIPHQKDLEAIAIHGTQSRLAKEIFQFVDSVNVQLTKQEPRRRLAVERMTRLVNTVWPRAQVKLYGSHVTGLCLPSSDLDFVIRLPAVHKKAVADAPGALEGRNAINETKQKKLARKLKGESWIDPRSLKLIERTVVPVIKVSTKDTKAKLIHLDITFDAPGHHGSEAALMVSQILDELPMIRPLVLVLKQFLLDRGLLTAYTGGLSSYCLFLMLTRYLQEQSSVFGDVGSLLMGFLDFFGNYVSVMHAGGPSMLWRCANHVSHYRFPPLV